MVFPGVSSFDLCFLFGKGIGFYTQGSLSLPCLLAIKSSFLYLVFLVCFSGSSSTSSLSGASFLSLPLLVSASETDILLGSIAGSSGSSTILCFFFFLLRGLPLFSPCWESCSILLGHHLGYKGS